MFVPSEGSFDCGEVNDIKIRIQILLHPMPPIDSTRSSKSPFAHTHLSIDLRLADLLYVQHVKSLGNRQTFHPNKLDYDVFDIEIDIGPVNLLLHGLFLKKLWWIKVRPRHCH